MHILPSRDAGGEAGLRHRLGWAAMALCAVLVSAIPALAEHTRWWQQNSFDDLAKGTSDGVAIRSDGKLFLAPRFSEFADADLAYVLALRTDAKGDLYAAGGSNAKVLRFDASGKATKVFESQELSAQAIALDPAGNLFVGTSPDGKVYKVTPGGQSSVFFDPKTKYIWDLALDRDGTLYVATGDTGTIFAVKPDGKGEVFYSSDEAHIRALALDTNGDVLAGTEPDGLVMRVPKMPDAAARKAPNDAPAANQRRAFVLYETSRKEITALLRDANGNIYVAAVGEKVPVSPGQPQPQGGDAGATGGAFTITIGGGGNGQGNGAQQQGLQGQAAPFMPFPAVDSSSVYRIAKDGSPEELWSSRDELVYALGLLPNGKLLLGTGNQGAVLELEGNQVYSRLVRTNSGQATSIATGADGKLFVATGNPGKVYTLGPGAAADGTFESQPFDAHMFSQWGRLSWFAEGAAAGGRPRIELYARSGNTSDPDNNWSAWAGPYANSSGDKVDCPAGRFVQWKAVMHGAASGPVPELDWVNIAYLPKNVPPVITGIALQDPGVRAQSLSIQGASGPPSAQLRAPQSSSGSNVAAAFSSGPSVRFESLPQGTVQKGYQTVLWTADDANDDDMEFSIYYRGENETSWKLLKDHITNRFYSWDTTAMPDGAYYLKIVASDAPSNPPAEALTGERESDRFVVDNTPPTVTQLTAVSSGSANDPAIRVRFQASAPASSIARAQYSLDSGDWTLVFPTGELSDSPRESYDFQLQSVASGDHIVTVRVFDKFENVSSAKATVRLESSGN